MSKNELIIRMSQGSEKVGPTLRKWLVSKNQWLIVLSDGDDSSKQAFKGWRMQH